MYGTCRHTEAPVHFVSVSTWQERQDLPALEVPRHVSLRMRGLAKQFVDERCADLDSAEWADKIFRTTVLNYLVASSSLYWGFGPDVYKSRAGSRCDRAALRFLGAVRNASGLAWGHCGFS